MYGFLLFSAVVLSAVDVGSPMKISATVELNVSSIPADSCYREGGTPNCVPSLATSLLVTNNNRVVGSKVDFLSGLYAVSRFVHVANVTFLDVLLSNIRLPMILRVATRLTIICPGDHDYDQWQCKNVTSSGGAVGLIKIPKLPASPNSHLKAQLTFGDVDIDHFHWIATLFVNYDTSDITTDSECEDHPDDDLCPLHKPYLCPIFSDSMTNPCCPIDVDSSCMLRIKSNRKTTTNPTTTTSTTTPTTTTPTTTSTTTTPTTTSTTTTPTTTSTTSTSTPTTTTPSTTTPTTTTTPSTTTASTTSSSTTVPTTSSSSTRSTTSSTTTSTTTTPTTTFTTSTSPPTTSTSTTSVPTTIIIPTTAVKTDSTLTTTAISPPKCTPNGATVATPTTSTISTTTAVEAGQDSIPTCRENVYFWVMIEFILLTAVLLISLIFIAICNPRLESKFVEEEESEEEDSQ